MPSLANSLNFELVWIMSPPLPVILQDKCTKQLKKIQNPYRERIKSRLKEIEKNEIVDTPYLKGDLRFFKRIRIGDFRVLLAYCRECYEIYRNFLNCSICSEKNLDRIIVFSIDKRRNVYKKAKRRY